MLRPVLIRMLEGRVGSTLLMQILGSSPDVCFDRVAPFEHSYLTYLTRLLGQIAVPTTTPAVEGMTELIRSNGRSVGPLPFPAQSVDPGGLATAGLGGIWTAFSDAAVAADPGTPTVYAEKFWGSVAAVIAAGLDPVIVDLVRDPRDIVASIRAFNDKTGRPRFGRAEVSDDHQHLRRLTIGMSLRLAEFRQPLPAAHLQLRYEDLVADAEHAVEPLAELSGLRFDIDRVLAARPAMARHMTTAAPEASVGRWVDDLASDEVAMIERRLGREMVRLGYRLS